MTPSGSPVAVARTLGRAAGRLRFAAPVAHVYNPLAYAFEAHAAYLERYCRKWADVLLVGMNPGPWGMMQTGVPFGEVELVRDWLGIDRGVRRPRSQHPRRAIEGFDCRRSEVSGRRFWGWARDRFGSPDRFFDSFFVWNYCPLAFLEESGRNRTPDKLPPAERDPPVRRLRPRPAADRRVRVAGVRPRRRQVRPGPRPRRPRGGHLPDRADPAPESGEPGGQPRLGRPGREAAGRHRRPAALGIPLRPPAEPPVAADRIERVAVVGAGLMGHGIALELALAGLEVRIHSRTRASLDRARARIDDALGYLAGFGRITPEQVEAVPSRLRDTTDLEEAVSGADFAIESVFEDLDLKRRVFADLDRLCPERAILASNTSGLMPDSFAPETERRDRVLVTHYANPPHLVPLVEVVPASATSDAALQAACSLLERAGKRPVVVRKQVPGFVLNRLQFALLREALWLVENGVAAPQDVDYALSNSIGRRWSTAGIFEVFELAGWDLVASIAGNLLPHLAAGPEVPALLAEKVARGELGAKTGRGFYHWTPESAEELRQRIAAALVEIEEWR